MRLFSVSAEQPIPIPRGVVENLIACGLIDEPDDAPWLDPLLPNQAVRILSGPFADLEGICYWSSAQRVKLLVGMFDVELPRHAVA